MVDLKEKKFNLNLNNIIVGIMPSLQLFDYYLHNDTMF